MPASCKPCERFPRGRRSARRRSTGSQPPRPREENYSCRICSGTSRTSPMTRPLLQRALHRLRHRPRTTSRTGQFRHHRPTRDFRTVEPPPVMVTVGGTHIDVPYSSATITRKFRTCIDQRKFVLRFDRKQVRVSARAVRLRVNSCIDSVYSDRSSSLPSAGMM